MDRSELPDKSNLKKNVGVNYPGQQADDDFNKPVIPGTPFLGGQQQLNCVLAADSRGHSGGSLPQAGMPRRKDWVVHLP